MANRISVIIDATSDKAIGAVNRFKVAMADAEKNGTTRFKAGANQAFAEVQANAGKMAVAGGAAIGAFVLKAAGEFQKLGVAVGKFSAATGVSNEAASRLIEVAGDLGVETTSLESAIGRMNKTAGMSPDKFDKLGVAIARADDGGVDAQETFLNIVDRLNAISDPAERAKVATQLLGKGWADMAELIGQGSTELRASLDAVSDSKVFDDAEVEKARKLREAMDNLQDAIDNVTLAVGGMVGDFAPAVSTITGAIGQVSELTDKLAGLKQALLLTVPGIGPLTVFSNAVSEATDHIDLQSVSAEDLRATLEGLGVSEEKILRIEAERARIQADLAKATDGTTDATEASAAAAEEAGTAMTAAAAAGAAAAGAALATGAAVGVTTEKIERQKEAVDRVEEALGEYRNEFELLADAAGALDTALDQVTGGARDMEGATRAFEEGLDAVNESVKENGRSLDIGTDKGRANRQAIEDQLGAIEDYGVALVKQGSSTDDAADAMDLLTESYVNTLREAGFSEEAVRGLIDTLDATPEDKEIALGLVHDAEVKAALEDRLEQLEGIDEGAAAEIKALIDQGSFDVAKSKLDLLARERTVPFKIGGQIVSATTRNQQEGRGTPFAGSSSANDLSAIQPFGGDGVAMRDAMPAPKTFSYGGGTENNRVLDRIVAEGRAQTEAAEEAKKAAEERKKAEEDAAQAAEDAADRRREVWAAQLEFGEITRDHYKALLEGELANEEKYSDDWIAIRREMLGVDQANADDAEAARQAHRKAIEDAEKAHLDRVRKFYEDAFERRAALEASDEVNDAMAALTQANTDYRKAPAADKAEAAQALAEAESLAAEALYNRAAANAEVAGLDEGTTGWAAAVRAALLGDAANAPVLADEIARILEGIPSFANGGVMPGPTGQHGLAWVAGGERVLTEAQQRGGAGRSIVVNVGTSYGPAHLRWEMQNAIRAADRVSRYGSRRIA